MNYFDLSFQINFFVIMLLYFQFLALIGELIAIHSQQIGSVKIGM